MEFPCRFDVSFRSQHHLDLYLKRLGLPQDTPSLTYLNRLIRAHQHQIPFETFTRIEDYHTQPQSLMPVRTFIERLEKGHGGVCWTLARGFHWLLTQLGFSTEYYYMDPGHVCTVVELPEGKYYTDVGYGIALFEAKPLFESFETKSEQDHFRYEVKDETVLVTRTLAPPKTLILEPRTPAEIEAFFEKANVATSKFLNTLFINKFFAGKLIRATGDEITMEALRTVFQIDPVFYEKARKRLG